MYLAVTADEYELPLSWGFSLNDLVSLMGVSYNALWHMLNRHYKSRSPFNGYRYRIVYVNLEE